MALLLFFCFKVPRLKALILLNTGWPVSLNRCIILLAVESHSSVFWAQEEFPFHFSSDPGPKNVQLSLREFHRVILDFIGIRTAILIILFPLNVIEHWHEDDSVLELFVLDVISLRVFLDLLKNRQWWKSWEVFHSNSVASPSIPTASWYDEYFLKSLTWPVHLAVAPEISFAFSDTKNGISVGTYVCLRPLDRLIIGQHWFRPWWWWIFQAFHIHNFFRMFLHQLLSDVEQTFNLLEFCVLVDLRIRQIIRPKMDGGFHRRKHEHSHINTFVLYACIENVASLADIPNLFCRNWKILLMYWWFVYSMFLNSGDDAASFFVLLEFKKCFLSSLSVWSWSSHAVSSCSWNIFLLTHLRISDFWSWVGSHQFPGCYCDLLSFIGIPWSDQILQILWRDVLTLRIARHQAWSRFRHRRAFVRSRLLTSFWHGALLSNLENHRNGYKNTSRNS